MLLDLRRFLVKERVGFLKLADTYDLFDPDNNLQVGIAKEEVSGLVKALRLIISKKLMPTTIRVYEKEGAPPVLTLKRNVALFRPSVTVEDARGVQLGRFQGKVFSLGGGFLAFDPNGNQFGDLKGDWKGWNFQLLDGAGRELGLVTKKWAGIGKELFTNADNYIISVTDPKVGNGLMLAAGLAIDIVFKEKER